MPLLAPPEAAQDFLERHLRGTQEFFGEVLREIDSTSECRITPAADLCFPHDVIRLAGGFATGCFVSWRCDTPVIPVDITMNIDTSSVFEMSESIHDSISQVEFEALRTTIESESSYEWNFHKGNHFISFCQRASDSTPLLVIHSNEKEFKYQYNGLMPVEGNWYMPEIKTFRKGNRFLRLLLGDSVSLFCDLALMLEDFNVTRHRFMAHQIIADRARILNESHHHHYFMPSRQSAAIGCYIVDPGAQVLVFSSPGSPLYLFEAHEGGDNQVQILDTGEQKLLVPHGWGKTFLGPVEVSYDERLLTVNGMSFPVRPVSTLGAHPELVVRPFAEDPSSQGSLFTRMQLHTPGRVVDQYRQLASYSKAGYLKHGES